MCGGVRLPLRNSSARWSNSDDETRLFLRDQPLRRLLPERVVGPVGPLVGGRRLPLADHRDQLGLELRPREVALFVQPDHDAERAHLPRLAEGQLALGAGNRAGLGQLADQSLDVTPLRRARRTVRDGAWAPAHG